MCQDVKNEQSGSSSVGLAIERAIASGNFAVAKQAMLKAYNGDLGNVQKALGVIKTAPANVQSAIKNLLTFVRQIRERHPERIERAGADHLLRDAGQEHPAADRRRDHCQLVRLGVRRAPRDDHHRQHPVAFPDAAGPCPRRHRS